MNQQTLMDRRRLLKAAALLPAYGILGSAADEPWEWQSYSADSGSSRYAPLNQINRSSVEHLEVAWELETLPGGSRPQGTIQCNPIVVDGVMYVSGHGLHTNAIEAHTGKLLWTNRGFDTGARRRGAAGTSRGVTYWKDGSEERIFAPVREHILAINAKTGELIDGFGVAGAIEMTADLGRDIGEATIVSPTPAVVFEDLLITTSKPDEGPISAAPGHIRAYDCRTGKLRWVFHTIPHPGEFGYDTWPEDSWKKAGGANCWGGISIDHERGLAFLSTGSPTFDFWGGDRIGANLFGNSILCLDAATGKRVWHYQTVHHDLFDYDLVCAPNLVTVLYKGEPRDAIAQISKTGWVFLLDRETGEPLYPIEERPVPQSTVPGEQSWPTQPYVTEPPPFGRQYFSPDDIANLSPESHDYLVNERLKDVLLAPMFTPPMLDKEVIALPGYHGGANWGGASWVQESGVLFVNHNEIPWSLKLVRAPEGADYPFEHTGYLRPEDQDGYPALSPPWGEIAAIDLNTRKILWQVPLGEYDELTATGIPPTGSYMQGGNIATSGGLLFSAAAQDGVFRAFDQEDGKVLWSHALGGVGMATPSTYEADGRQFVVIASSPRSGAKGNGPKAGFTAYALPK
jgi:quinoprotein glucose dehydrogenase